MAAPSNNPFLLRALLLSGMLASLSGCNSIMNGWLDPTVLGNFENTGAMDIRTSLTLEDTPWGVPGSETPQPQDLLVRPVEYPVSPGDTLELSINELRDRGVPFQSQVYVSNTGFVNLPVVGRIDAKGLTTPELEDRIIHALQDRQVLVNPQVTVNPLFLQHATYSIFGIGVSAATNAPLRAGTFPIRKPDLRILEAINQVGGLNEYVTEIYVFRQVNPPWASSPTPGADAATPATPGGDASGAQANTGEGQSAIKEEQDVKKVTPEEEVLGAVLEPDTTGQPPGEEETGSGIDENTAEQNHEEMVPFLYVDGAFVRNPALQKHADRSLQPEALQGTEPTIDWERIAGTSSYRVIRIPADRLRNGDPETNVVVRGGDVIRIVSGEVGVYYVMGQVNRVGEYRFNAEKITLKAAIAAAGGLTGLAWPDRCTVYRRIGQREQMIQVDLDRIFAGKDPDFLILRGDIINVGTHPFAPFLASLRGFTIPLPSTNVGYSFVYSRNFADIDSFSVRQNPANVVRNYPLLTP